MCTVENCGNGEIVARGLCNKHYTRWRNYGDPLHTVKPHGTLLERFEAKVEKTDTCWLWTGNKSKQGYGKIRAGKKGGEQLRAHRVAYELFNGPLAPSQVVMHTCDNPSCVNPAHLRAGTHQDNSDDMVEKDRHAYGERTQKSRLTELAVRLIRASPDVSLRELAETFNVGLSTVCKVRYGKTWRHVK